MKPAIAVCQIQCDVYSYVPNWRAGDRIRYYTGCQSAAGPPRLLHDRRVTTSASRVCGPGEPAVIRINRARMTINQDAVVLARRRGGSVYGDKGRLVYIAVAGGAVWGYHNELRF